MASVSAPRGHLAVVGGGVIGLTCALAAADAGFAVEVIDAGQQDRASWVAGGMLGSLGEGHPGEEHLLDISVASVGRWPALVERLGDPEIVTATDSLFVATTAADMQHYGQLARFVWSQRPTGNELEKLTGRELRRLDGMLSSRLIGGYRAVGEWSVDNRRLLCALRRSGESAGIRFSDRRVADLAEVTADQVVVAAGLGSRDLCDGLALHAAKGEILRLRRTPGSVTMPSHVIRAQVRGRSVYLVPRSDGIVVGATQYEPEEPTNRPEAGGVADLLADAIEIMPGLRTYELAEAGAGLRPATPDGLPIIRRLDDRTVVATGHGRNGIVLAPYTAGLVLELLGGSVPQQPPVSADQEKG